MKIVKICSLLAIASLTFPTAIAQNAADSSPIQNGQSNDVVVDDFSGTINFDNTIDEIVVEDFTGRITVSVGGTQATANLQGINAGSPTDLRQNGSSVLFAGEERPRNFDISREIGWHRDRENALSNYLADFPSLTISVPAGTALRFEDVITIATIGNLDGDLEIDGGYVDVDAGDMYSADVSVHGPGDIMLGHVQEAFIASIHGSGDISAKSAGTTRMSVHGSGDANVGNINGDATLNVHGSGNIDTGTIAGAIRANIHGSGDIQTGSVAQSGELSIHGSGDISLETINGPSKADIFGSGNISISSGRAQSLRVSINGSGDFDFGGVSTNLVANLRGSGGIDIAQNEGTMRTSGRGNIRVGGIRVNDDN